MLLVQVLQPLICFLTVFYGGGGWGRGFGGYGVGRFGGLRGFGGYGVGPFGGFRGYDGFGRRGFGGFKGGYDE